jgi:alpha-N-arabinofuranosidase
MRALLLILFAFSGWRCAAAETPPLMIEIDTTKTLSDVSRRPLGINVNYLMDGDRNRHAPRSTADALEEMGVKFLRYPGGDKSDSYLWSVPPFDKPRPTLARTGADVWPSCDRTLVNADMTYKIHPLDFDEFMQACIRLKAEPVIVICHEPMYHAAAKDGTTTSRERLLETAREWVRYANIQKKYGVKYWEIGNETYLKTKNGDANAEQYAADLVEFSRQMKAVDPSILIGANGQPGDWWKTILANAGGSIDYLSVHEYPCWEWKTYEAYRTKNPRLTGEVDQAAKAIDTHAPAADRKRLKIAVTEMNAFDWAKDGWPRVNDSGHAIVLCDIIGQMLQHPRLEFLQVWNTRWVKNDTASPPQLADALDKNNDLNASGRIMAIWGKVLLAHMLPVEQTDMVRAFACADADRKHIHVLLINKDTAPHDTQVSFKGVSELKGSSFEFTGTSPEDTKPTWSHRGPIKSTGPLTMTLKPLCVTALLLRVEK